MYCVCVWRPCVLCIMCVEALCIVYCVLCQFSSRLGHSHAAVLLQESSGVDPEDDSETGSEEEEDMEDMEDGYSLSNPLEEEEEEEEEGEDTEEKV